jgi:hypothetical protein
MEAKDKPLVVRRTPVTPETVPVKDKAGKDSAAAALGSKTKFDKVVDYLYGMIKALQPEEGVVLPVGKAPQAAAIEKLLENSTFDDEEVETIAKICTVLVGSPVTPKIETEADDDDGYYPYKRGLIVVPRSKDSGHNYALGKPIMITEWDGDDDEPATCLGIKLNGTRGNWINLDDSVVRLATREEVITFLKAVGLEKACEEAGIVFLE